MDSWTYVDVITTAVAAFTPVEVVSFLFPQALYDKLACILAQSVTFVIRLQGDCPSGRRENGPRAFVFCIFYHLLSFSLLIFVLFPRLLLKCCPSSSLALPFLKLLPKNSRFITWHLSCFHSLDPLCH